MVHMDLSTVLRNRTERDPNDVALMYMSDSDRYEVRNYRDLDARARCVAGWLRARCATGDRVLLLYPAGPEFTAAFFGCSYAGLIAVPAPKPGRYQHERRRLAGIARDCGARVVLTDRANLPVIEKWVVDEGLVDVVCHATDDPGDLGDLGDPDTWVASPVSPDVPALLQYTSGSTGQPKGVVVSHRNLLTNVDGLASVLGVAGMRTGGWIPLYHDMGLIGVMLLGVLRGTGYVQMDPMTFLRRPHLWLRMLDEQDVAMTAAPNFGYELCTRRVTDEQLAELDLSRLRAACNGSEPVHPGSISRFCERFASARFRPEAMVPMYGLAENTLMASGTFGRPPLRRRFDVVALEQQELRPAEPDRAARVLVGCGRPNEADELRIVDPLTHNVLPEGRIGEIWISGPNVAGGYWDKEQASAEIFQARTADGQGPFLRTGDLGALLDDDLFITGRRKDTLIVHGRNLHPHDIEQELREQHEELDGLHGAVCSVSGPHDDELLVVVHEIRSHWGEQRLREIASAMKQTLVREFGAPVGAVVLVRPGAVRRTTSGKIQRSATRELYLSGELETLMRSEDSQLTEALADRRAASGR